MVASTGMPSGLAVFRPRAPCVLTAATRFGGAWTPPRVALKSDQHSRSTACRTVPEPSLELRDPTAVLFVWLARRVLTGISSAGAAAQSILSGASPVPRSH